MIRYWSFVLLSLILWLPALPGMQTPTSATPQSKPKPDLTKARETSIREGDKPDITKAADSSEAAQRRSARRAQARSLLIALASDARTFNDQTLRARSLARIADTLWQVDADQGRLLFRKAWEAAELADQESDKKTQEEIRQQRTKTGGGFAINLPANIRREVLRLVVRHDRSLSEEFLDKLKSEKQEATTNRDSFSSSDAQTERLGVAKELLAAGDVEKALQLADVALKTVTMAALNFLEDVREKNSALADARYAALLTASAGNMQADANTVSLLSSYIFTPRLYIMFSRGGNTSSSSSGTTGSPPNVSPELRQAFLQIAGAILLRPLPPPGEDQSTAGVEGKYLVIKRLLPFFEQYASQDVTEALRGQLEALSAVLPESIRQREDEWLRKGTSSEKPAEDVERSLLDRIDRARTSEERDSLFVQVAFRAASRGDLRARDFVSRIDDTELRKQIQAYVDATLAIHFVGKKDVNAALDIARKGELTHTHRAWVMVQCAKLLAKSDHDRALQLLEEAGAEARRIEVSDPDLPRMLLAVANAIKLIDPPQVWDATFDAIKAANSAEGFTGEDGSLTLKFQSKGQSSVYSTDVDDFDVEGIFRDLATQDYDRAVELARGFQGEGPRAVATIAIARSVLEEKKTAKAVSRN